MTDREISRSVTVGHTEFEVSRFWEKNGLFENSVSKFVLGAIHYPPLFPSASTSQPPNHLINMKFFTFLSGV